MTYSFKLRIETESAFNKDFLKLMLQTQIEKINISPMADGKETPARVDID